MKLQLPWRRQLPEDELAELEAQLDAALVPVPPRLEFVRGLGRRLRTGSFRELDAPTPIILPENKAARYLILGGVGMLSGTLVIVVAARALIAVLAVLGILQQVREKPVPNAT